MQARGKAAGEVDELLELESRGFVRDMLKIWAQFFAGQDGAEKSSQQGGNDALIAVKQLPDWQLDSDTLQGWVRQLTEISDRHREVMIEF